MSCHPRCNQGRHCDGSCRRRADHDEPLSWALLYLAWFFAVAALAYMVWGA